jgi:2-methylcitrate dehydratase PrpD
VLELVAGRRQDEPIGRIAVDIFPEARKLPNEIAPKSLEGGQFSVPFAAALAALRGAEAFRPLRPHSLSDPEVVELAQRVAIRYPDEFAGIFPQRTPARVTMVVRGRERVVDVPRPLGDANNPMDQSAVEDKLHDLGRDVLSHAELGKLIQAVAQLGQGKIAPLLACLSAEPVASTRTS